jgi:hypothetical protein
MDPALVLGRKPKLKIKKRPKTAKNGNFNLQGKF